MLLSIAGRKHEFITAYRACPLTPRKYQIDFSQNEHLIREIFATLMKNEAQNLHAVFQCVYIRTLDCFRLFGHARRIIGLWVAVHGHAKAIKVLVRVISRRK